MTRKERAAKIIEVLRQLFPRARSELVYHKDRPYEFLFAVILSAQCTDKMVNKVTARLFEKYTNLEDYCKATLEEFSNDIKSIGLYRGKAKNILATAKLLREKHGGNVPQTMRELTALPGVARKTANVVLGELYSKNEGIAVDTHVKRLAKAFGLTSHDDPVKVEKDLMAVVPRQEWAAFSLRLILYGRYYWPARQKEHDGPLAQFAVTH